MEAYDQRNYTLTGGKEPETISAPAVSPGLFPFLGVRPLLGRLFQPEDAENRVALLSEEFWKRYFGAAPDAIGKTLTLNAQSYTVVGVMPPGFKFPYGTFQAWVPLSLNPLAEARARTIMPSAECAVIFQSRPLRRRSMPFAAAAQSGKT